MITKTLIYGAMGSGKSGALLTEIISSQALYFSVLCIDGSGSGQITARSGESYPAEDYKNIDFDSEFFKNVEVVVIDEAQFIERAWLETFIKASREKYCFIAMLKRDSFQNEFENYAFLESHATNLIKCTALCEMCNKKMGGITMRYPEYPQDRILLDKKAYVNVCRECYDKAMK